MAVLQGQTLQHAWVPKLVACTWTGIGSLQALYVAWLHKHKLWRQEARPQHSTCIIVAVAADGLLGWALRDAMSPE